MAPTRAPVFVLGPHRSGTSAVTGLLAQATGLDLGDRLLRANRTNAKGYFEAAEVVRAHNAMLAAVDRDWTCPPAWIQPDEVHLAPLRRFVARMETAGISWGLKDPRLLFTLPAWLGLVDRVRLMGVIRDHEEMVRSLVARDGLDAAAADLVARSHVARLRHLRATHDFPLVHFTAPIADVVASVRGAAIAIGLPWDDDAARGFLDPALAGSRSDGVLVNPDIDHLRALPAVTRAPDVAANDLADTLRGSGAGPDDRAALHHNRFVGPRFKKRTRFLWRGLPDPPARRLEVRRIRDLVGEPWVPGVVERAAGHVADLDVALARVDGRPWDVVVLPDPLAWLSLPQLAGGLRRIRAGLVSGGHLVVGLATADNDLRATWHLPTVALDDLVAAVVDAGFDVVAVDREPFVAAVRARAPAPSVPS